MNDTDGTLDVQVVLHGSGPFAAWAAATRPGERIEGIGPRGAVTLRTDLSQHLLVGDDSALVVTMAMVEAVPSGATATALLLSDIEVVDSGVGPNVEVIRVSDEPTLISRLEQLPLGADVAAYLNEERSLVRKASAVLIDRGLPVGSVATKAYWRVDGPNAAHGEPPRD